ncbi:MAG: carboxypeptidase-like regulatory domain-containing protein [Gemmatimonadota bacterium]
MRNIFRSPTRLLPVAWPRISCILLGLLAGCDAYKFTDGSQVCTTEARAGITISVRDSVTDALAGRGSRIIATSGSYADTARFSGNQDGPFALVYERAGTYVVTVEQTGYKTWTKSGVEVTKAVCHVNGVDLVARLQH